MGPRYESCRRLSRYRSFLDQTFREASTRSTDRNDLYQTNFSGGTTILTVGGVVFGTRKMEMTKEKRIQDKYEKYEA